MTSWLVLKVDRRGPHMGIERIGEVKAPNQPKALLVAAQRWPERVDHDRAQGGLSVRTTPAGGADMRVQIPAYTDRWMRGDRYGEVVKTTKSRKPTDVRAGLLTRYQNEQPHTIAHVKLDKSGKTVRVMLNDCTVVS